MLSEACLGTCVHTCPPLQTQLPWGCPSPSSSFSSSPRPPWGSPSTQGLPLSSERRGPSPCHAARAALARLGAHTTPPRAGLTFAWLSLRALGRRVRLGVLRGCGGSSFYTCSRSACLHLGAAAVLPPLLGTPAWHWPPPGARWHLARPHQAGQTDH